MMSTSSYEICDRLPHHPTVLAMDFVLSWRRSLMPSKSAQPDLGIFLEFFFRRLSPTRHYCGFNPLGYDSAFCC
ncbi:hypothetical protein FOZ61_000632 [Perkinsus olseni]|uniref:Uncharacterized protein n=1 Tax=Perkinsus olseni TaxID=32597 RepID=A0A7J6KS51_PEROL|nr:hypothetical protein FOZ61_000632 [Perkinsus olseni]